ncbi:MAG: ATP citrate synthase [Candidatus Bathyarchaeota archaeon]|nr:MAG: ATP citrate synthase [Candidatus Bathyarchaeota archaeon]
MKMKKYELFDRNTQALIFGYQQRAIQRMLDFDYACKRETPSIAAIVNPTRSGYHKCFWGSEEIILPMYTTIKEASKNHPQADVMINFASFRSAYPRTKEAFEIDTIRTVAIIAEGIPERYTKKLIAIAKQKGKWIIGPATVGGIKGGAFKIGNTGGMIDNIIASRLHRPGSVAFVSKSGGLLNELNNIISRNSDGVYEGIAIGGDLYPGSTFKDHIMRYEKDANVAMIVLLGEVGGKDEYDIVSALKAGEITKPLVAWCIGTCSGMFSTDVQFGHAGARARTDLETADAKNRALKEAGAVVPDSFDDLGDKINKAFWKLVKDGRAKPKPDREPRVVPMDLNKALAEGKIRAPTHFISTITDERGDQPLYAGIPLTEIIDRDYGIGGVIGLLWFKKKFPDWARGFIELVLQIVADHGPAVSGAHNAIISARAGKDLISSLVSGLLTIGPRFGGAIDGAAYWFRKFHDDGKEPDEMVSEMKAMNTLIPGIGHRVKSVINPDKRVEMLKKYAKGNFPKTEYLDYALRIEKITTAKRDNLILNVDGCVGILFLDLLNSLEFSENEISDIIGTGALNGLFVLGRSIGFMGHILDQKRLEAGLYRHPWNDILYVSPKKEELEEEAKKWGK